jgi:phage shock protein PspC (stress-responsive transcriptional regulator)
MKEIERLSIGGYAFTLEKDAAAEVEQYLNGLEAHYLGQEGGKEIMEGIEERMAELLLEKCGQGGVVTLSGIRGVIDILGRPERIEADDPEPEAPREKPRRRMYRDLENKQVAGVCAGLGNYLNLDVALCRLVFVLVTVACFFGFGRHGMWSLTGLGAYALFWIAMPPARTAQERWAMKGDAGTLDDIQRNVRSGIQEMGEAARKGVQEVGDAVRSRNGQELGKILLIIIGIVLLLSGVSGLASVSVIGLKGPTLFSAPLDHFLDDLSANVPVFYDMLNTPWILVLAILAVVLPLIGLIYGGIRMIFGFKSPKWRPGLVIFILWLVDLVVLGVLCFFGMASTEYLLSL